MKTLLLRLAVAAVVCYLALSHRLPSIHSHGNSMTQQLTDYGVDLHMALVSLSAGAKGTDGQGKAQRIRSRSHTFTSTLAESHGTCHPNFPSTPTSQKNGGRR